VNPVGGSELCEPVDDRGAEDAHDDAVAQALRSGDQWL
jgi:hypothetical protein